MSNDLIQKTAENGRIVWNKHALERMLERNIARAQVKFVLKKGEIIESYEHDKPLPSYLLFGWVKSNPLHVVAAYNDRTNHCYIITVYVPDQEHFYEDFKTRRK